MGRKLAYTTSKCDTKIERVRFEKQADELGRTRQGLFAQLNSLTER
jgi:hypothetical protein